MDNSKLTLLSPTEVWDRVDPLAPDLDADPGVAGLAGLPYGQLGGPGFERLCYELLVSEGHSPRFFGRSGQADYGVDIIVEKGDTCTVYQCKNLAEEPKWQTVRDAVIKFKTDWLDKAGLPHPDAFVYCCPHPLDDKTLGEEWSRCRKKFKRRTGVDLGFWDRNTLDTRLRQLPDVVAGLFSDSYAEHFCGRDEWRDDPWTRIRWGVARHASIKRFLDRHQDGRVSVAEPDAERFSDTLSVSPVLVIRGLPGAGKTVTGLELASRLEAPRRRIYYASLKDAGDPQRLWQSVRRRGSLPALFLLDDCHLNLEQTDIVRQRLGPELRDLRGNMRLLLILRDLPASGGNDLDDTPDWLAELAQDDLVIDLKTDLARTRSVTEHLRPELVGLSRERLERLHHQTGGDLLLLDELLDSLDSLQDLDELHPEHLYHSTQTHYFGGRRRLPTLLRLACLAQFDLVPLASYLDTDWQPGEKELTAPLMTELFAPPVTSSCTPPWRNSWCEPHWPWKSRPSSSNRR